MKTQTRSLAIAAGLLALFAALSTQAANLSCMTVISAASGQFRSAERPSQCGKQIEVVNFAYSVVSSRDVASGQATGRRAHRPVRITKEWSPSSIQFFEALIGNRLLTTVSIDFFVTDQNGKVALDHTIKLSSATVSSIEHVSNAVTAPNQPSLPAMETVEFTFQQIELIDHRSQTIAADSLQNNT